MKTNDLTHTPRERTSVFITGVDTSTPDDLVKDGMCEELHNMRYESSAWRPVHQFKTKTVLMGDIDAEFDIVYHHPAAGDNTYIARYKDEPDDYASITFYEDKRPTITPIIRLENVVSISHFGNVLTFITSSTVVYLVLKDGEYKKINFPPYAKLSITGLNAVSPEPTEFWAEYSDKVERYPYSLEKMGEVIRDGGSIFEYNTAIHNLTTDTDLLPNLFDGAWRGEIMLFSTWVMDDGTCLAPSPLLLVHSSRKANIPYDQGYHIGVYKDNAKGDSILTLGNSKKSSTLPFQNHSEVLSTIQPTLKIRIRNDWDYSFVHRLAIWATRIHPTFITQMPTDPVEAQDMIFRFADNDLANQPFYKLTEIDVSKFTEDDTPDAPNIPEDPDYNPDEGYDPDEGRDEPWDPGAGRDDGYDDWGDMYTLSAGARSASTHRKYEFQLRRDMLTKAVTNEVYEPNNNTHITIPTHSFDYNNRNHLYAFKESLALGYHISDSNNPLDANSVKRFDEWVEMSIDDKNINIVSYSDKQGYSLLEGTPMYDIISYPDFRAKRYSVSEHFIAQLKPALNNNFAWYRQPSTKFEKFPPIKLDGRVLTGDQVPVNGSIVTFDNKVKVSATNNLFSSSFENSYTIGSATNRILALQSAAIEMHEMKVGELPLYAFTEEGIFALVAGAETLYASVAAINYDKIINPNTLAINGAIVYITEKGVHLLTTSGTQIISTPIHGANGMPPLDFLRTCKILWPKQYNDIVLFNEAYSKAYVYNLDAGYWSTRDLAGHKINTDELVNGQYILDLADEDESKALPCRITTRPIKLGDVEFKRLETIIPRMATNNHSALIDLQIDGSVDGSAYRQLRVLQAEDVAAGKVNPIVLRRTPFSAKYFKVMLGLDAEPDKTTYSTSITHIDFEWYRKLRHRMR